MYGYIFERYTYMLKKLFTFCALICSVLTFFGVGYVFYSNGAPNAGFAVVPMLGVIIFTRLAKKYS